MKKAIFFDIDDTLYNQLIPFKKAYKNNFDFGYHLMVEMFKKSRMLSDEVFELTEKGVILIEKMHIYRIKKALKIYGYKISDFEVL